MNARWTEAERLVALRSYGVLDTDEDFTGFVEIAAQICNAPIAVVNFIDEARQWFGAEIGLGVRETPLDISICARAILQDDIFVVPDLSLDARFERNPLIAGDPRLRFYGGALLKTPAGLPIGTMCVLDYVPRPAGLTDVQRRALQALARQVMTQLELRSLLGQKELLLKEAHHRVSNSLTRVKSLLSVQAARAQTQESAALLNDAARRVQVFADMHRHLYDDTATAEVDLPTYLKKLVEADNEFLSAEGKRRSASVVGSGVPWPALDAPNLGLVTIELVSNAIKYGQGDVTVTVRRDGEAVEIVVEDEGQDLPSDLSVASGTGLGMLIINGLLEANDGTLIVDRSCKHTRFIARSKRP